MNYKVVIAALLVSTIVYAEPEFDPLPDGYELMGNGGGLALEGTCEMGVDRAMAAAGGAGLEEVGGPGRLVRSRGALWIAVGSPGNGTLINDMGEQSIRGYTSWEYRDFVVDVPEDSGLLLLGFWMQGQGQFWIRDQKLEIVPETVRSI